MPLTTDASPGKPVAKSAVPRKSKGKQIPLFQKQDPRVGCVLKKNKEEREARRRPDDASVMEGGVLCSTYGCGFGAFYEDRGGGWPSNYGDRSHEHRRAALPSVLLDAGRDRCIHHSHQDKHEHKEATNSSSPCSYLMEFRGRQSPYLGGDSPLTCVCREWCGPGWHESATSR